MASKFKKDTKVSEDKEVVTASKEKGNSKKSKRKFSKSKSRKEDSSVSKETSKTSSGDVLTAILTRYPEDYLNSSSLFFSNKLGLDTSRVIESWSSIDGTINRYLPFKGKREYGVHHVMKNSGIMKLNLRPHIDSNSELSVINTLSSSLFKFIRSANAGQTHYESSDIMIYQLAITSIYAQMARLARAYKLIGQTRMMNLYWGDKILEALQIDANKLYVDQAAFRSAYNVLVRKINTLALPSYSLLNQRWNYLLSNVFTDDIVETSQYYLIDMPYMLEYNGYTDRKGGKLESKRFMFDSDLSSRLNDNELYGDKSTNSLNPLNLLKYLTNYVETLLNDSDFNIMNGDILKAFGNDSLYQLSFLEEMDSIEPIYDPGMLLEINNSNIAPFHMTEVVQEGKISYGNDRRSILRAVYQDPSGKYMGDHYLENQMHWAFMNNVYFNALTDVPSPEEVIRGTRLSSLAWVSTARTERINNKDVQVTDSVKLSAGTETVESYTIYTSERSEHMILTTDTDRLKHTLQAHYYTKTFYDIASGEYDKFVKWTKFIMRATRFNRAPRFALRFVEKSNANNFWEHGDLGRYTVIDMDVLSRIHRSAAQSIFGMPSIVSNHKFSESGGQKSKMKDK